MIGIFALMQQAVTIFGRYPFRRRTVYEEYGQYKFKIYGKPYWEENHRSRNKADKIRNKSMTNDFTANCLNHDKNMWPTIFPFITDTIIIGFR